MGRTNAVDEAAFQREMMGVVREAQWSFLATAQGDQPRVRPVHAVWDGFVCYVATGPTTAKVLQVADNPKTEMLYWVGPPKFVHLTLTGPARMVTDAGERLRVWHLFGTAPEGYDPKMLWPQGPDASFAVLRIDPTRIEITAMPEHLFGVKPRVWRP